jgi:MFS family permease
MFPLYLVGAMSVPIRADLDITTTQLGALVSVFFGVGAVLMPLGGQLVDRMGPRRSARLALGGAAACLAAVAVFGGTYPGLLAAMAVGGLASAVAGSVGGMIIARAVPPGRRPLAFAVERSSIPAATLIAGLCVPTLSAVLPWRVVFAFGAVLVAAALLLPVPAVPDAEPVPDSEPVPEADPPPHAHPVAYPVPPSAGGRLRPLGPLLLVTAMFLLGCGASTALSTFFVGHAVRLGIADGAAGIALAVTSAATIGVRMVLGILGTRVRGRGAATALLFAGAAGFALLAVPTALAAWVGAVLAGAAGWGWTGILGLAVVQAHPDAPGASTALVQAGGSAGGIGGPVLVGWLAERYDYGTAWLTLTAVLVVGGLVAAVNGGIWRTGVDHGTAVRLTSERTGVTHSGTAGKGERCRTDR